MNRRVALCVSVVQSFLLRARKSFTAQNAEIRDVRLSLPCFFQNLDPDWLGLRNMGMKFIRPVRAAMCGNVESEFKPAPYPQLVECGAEIILYYLLGCSDHPGNFAIG